MIINKKLIANVLSVILMSILSGLTFADEEKPIVTQSNEIKEEAKARKKEVQDSKPVNIQSVQGGSSDFYSIFDEDEPESLAAKDVFLGFEEVQLTDSSLFEAVDPISGDKFNSQSLRGFDAIYNNNYLDGNPVWSVEDREDRTTRFDIFPSMVIDKTKTHISKSVTADKDANTIGAHTNSSTVQAFDLSGKSFYKASGSGGYFAQNGEPDSGEVPYAFSGLAMFNFGAKNNLSAIFAADISREEQFQDSTRAKGGYQFSAGLVDVPQRQTLEHASLFQSVVERQVFFGKLEAKTDKLYSFITLDYFREVEDTNSNTTGYFIDPANLTSFTQGTGTFSAGQATAEFDELALKRNIGFFGSGFDYNIGENDLISGRAAFTYLDLDTDFDRSEPFVDADSGQLSYDVTGDTLTLDVATPGTNPATFAHGVGSTNLNKGTFSTGEEIVDKQSSLQLDYTKNLDPGIFGFSFKTGASWRRLDRELDTTLRQYSLPGTATFSLLDTNPGLTTVNPLEPIFINRDAYWNFIMSEGNLISGATFAPQYELVEDVFAGYGMGIYNNKLLRFSAGLRVEYTNFTLDNVDITEASSSSLNQMAASYEDSYINLLPSAQLIIRPLDDATLRFSYSRTLARPDFDDFAIGDQFFVGSRVSTTIFANPFLDPRTSDNFDASAAYGFEDLDGGVSLGLFYKNIQDEIFTEVIQPIGGTTRTETPSNASEARVFGVETALAIGSFDFLPKPYDGLGIKADFTYIHGEWDITNSDGSQRTVLGHRNQPEYLSTVSLNYNYKKKFGAYLKYKLRGRTFTGEFGPTAQNDIWVDDFAQLDAGFSYKLSWGVSLFVAGKNLTDAVTTEVSGSSIDLVSRTFQPGPSVFAGFKLKL